VKNTSKTSCLRLKVFWGLGLWQILNERVTTTAVWRDHFYDVKIGTQADLASMFNY
jgi:hypothetical protein